MLSAMKSEFRKLLTIRSTYAIFVISLAIVALFAGYGDGYRASQAALAQPGALMTEPFNAVVFVGLILAFAGLLLVAHEYRYNTIVYTMTSSNSRLKVLLAKFLTISIFAVVTGLMLALFAPLCTIVGAHLHGYNLGPQHFDYWTVIWRCAFVAWGYAMYAFILIAIMRNQVGSIITFLLVPLIGENIIRSIFEKTSDYLPFTMLQAVATPTSLGNNTSTTHAVTVSVSYVVGGLIISAVLFWKRDASSN